MIGSRRYLLWVFAMLLVAVLLASAETAPRPAFSHEQGFHSNQAKTRRVLTDQRILIEELRGTAKELEKDANDMHGEFCP